MSAALVLALLALLLACISIALRYWDTPPELARRVTQLEVDLMEGLDTMSRWMKRENVRRARDVKEAGPSAPVGQEFTIDSRDPKAHLRARARQKGLMQ